MQVLTKDKEVMGKFYESWAFVHSSTDALPRMVSVIQPLSQHPFTLSLDFEINRWDLH